MKVTGDILTIELNSIDWRLYWNLFINLVPQFSKLTKRPN